jgi:hypothetical protein
LFNVKKELLIEDLKEILVTSLTTETMS